MERQPMDLSPELHPYLELKGQRVFAGRAFKTGEFLERSPVIPIPAEEWSQITQTVLRFYGYPWGKENKDAALALGKGSFFRNSIHKPAVYFVQQLDFMVLEFFAARDIKQGEEITVDRRQPGQA